MNFTILKTWVAAIALIFPVMQQPASALTLDSLFEPVFSRTELLPQYHLKFDLSTFAFHRNAFFKRQYLAEAHPDLEFKLLSYDDVIASVWNVDFLFGLGQVPGNTVFTVLNVGFGIDPTIEFKLSKFYLRTGLSHHCFHEIDNALFPLIHHNRLHLDVTSHNFRLNDYFKVLYQDTLLSSKNRYSWKIDAGYYLHEFFDLASPGKLNGNSPLQSEISFSGKCAVNKRRSWVFALRGDHIIGLFDKNMNFHVNGSGNLFWKTSIGAEAYFTRGKQGGCFYFVYHIDDLPVPDETPEIMNGNWRFSKNRLAQIGLIFFN